MQILLVLQGSSVDHAGATVERQATPLEVAWSTTATNTFGMNYGAAPSQTLTPPDAFPSQTDDSQVDAPASLTDRLC